MMKDGQEHPEGERPPPEGPRPPAGRETRPAWVNERIAEIVAGVSDRRSSGEEVDLAQVVAANPQLAPHLENDLAFHALITGNVSSPCDQPGVEAPEGDIFTALPAPFGEYEVLKKLGSGAMGQVYLARQPSVGRLVALKLTSPRHAGKRSAVERFLREARAAGKLDHPAIVTVYDAGVLDSMPFIAMRYVEGETLSRVIQGEAETSIAGGVRDPVLSRDRIPRFVHLVERTARAIHAAHEHGLIHRDIKPSNVMVTPDGEVVVLDMGLVRLDVPDCQTLTGAGEILGTPAYMAPELLRDGDARASRSTDVYSLGVTLFETLTLRRPFSAPTFVALTQKILHDEPPDARALNPGVPRDLRAVLGMTLDKDPKRRYRTALELAEELRRVREFEPVRARALGPVARFARWTRRNPVPASMTIGAFAVLVLGLAVTSFLLCRLEKEKDEKDAALRAKDTALDRAEGARLAALSAVTLPTDPGLSLVLALKAEGHAPGRQAEDAAAAALERLHERRTLFGHSATVNDVCFTADGRRVVTASSDYSARVWDARDGTLLQELRGHLNGAFSCDVSSDDQRLLTCSSDKTAIVWDLTTGRKLAVLTGHEDKVTCARFGPDGRVATSDSNGTIKIWRAADGSEVRSFRAASTGINSVAFSPDGRRIAIGADGKPGEPGSVCTIWDADAGVLVRTLVGHESHVNWVSYDSTGERLVTASNDKTVAVWNADSGQQLGCWPAHDGEVLCASFSPDGESVATCSADLTAKVWDLGTLKPVATLLGHTRKVFCVRFSPDGARLVTSSEDGTARIWDLAPPPEFLRFHANEGQVLSADYSGDGRKVITAHGDRAARIWSSVSGKLLLPLGPLSGQCTSAAFSPDGARAITAADDGTCTIWDAGTGALLVELERFNDSANWVEFSPRGAAVLSAAGDGTVRLSHAETGKRIRLLGGRGKDVTCAAFSPDGQFVATAAKDLTARVFRVEDGREIAVCRGHQADVLSVRFDRSGGFIVTGSRDATARIWDARTGEQLHCLRGHSARVRFASFSPSGAEVVTASWDKTVRVWDVATENVKFIYKGHTGNVHTARFSPDGTRILTASADGYATSLPKDLMAAARDRQPRELSPSDREALGLFGESDEATLRAEWRLQLERAWLEATRRSLAKDPGRYGTQSEYLRAVTNVIGALGRSSDPRRRSEALALAREAGEKLLPEVWRAETLRAWDGWPSRTEGIAIRCLERVAALGASPTELKSLTPRLVESLGTGVLSFAGMDALFKELRASLLARGAPWRFQRGTAQSVERTGWTGPDFDDSTWEAGRSEFSILHDDLGTTLTEPGRPEDGVVDLFLRARLDSIPAGTRSLVLAVCTDNGFVAYLNGSEVGRVRAGARPGEGAPAAPDEWVADHDNSEPYATAQLSIDRSRLLPGGNVLAIRGARRPVASRGMYLLPMVFADLEPSSETELRFRSALIAGDRGPGAEARGAYLAGRMLEARHRLGDAAAKLAKAHELEPQAPEPTLRLAAVLEELGRMDQAEALLRRAIDESARPDEGICAAWIRVALGRLGKGGVEAARSLPGKPESPWRRDLEWALLRLAAEGAIRIDCGGGGLTDAAGKTWGPDRFFSDDYSFGEDYSGVDDRPVAEAAALYDAQLHLGGRSFPRAYSGGSVYRVPLPRGDYRVTLHFAETRLRRPETRIFGILLEGRCVLDYFEPLSAGFAVHAERSFDVLVTDGVLDLGFLYTRGMFHITALEIEERKQGT